jgi:hypothetical protein
MPPAFDFALLAAFCVVLFVLSLRNIRRKWILGRTQALGLFRP